MKPLKIKRWNQGSAAHLLVRAGFAATSEQIAATAKLPMEKAVDALFNQESDIEPPDWVTPESVNKPSLRDERGKLSKDEMRAARKKRQRDNALDVRFMGSWWIDRMISTSCPLQEKMTLF